MAVRRADRPSGVVRREDANPPEIARASELDPAGLVPGSAAPLAPPTVLERLNARLSRTAVAVADIEYPEAFVVAEGEAPSRNGTLIVAKALLTPDMPYELLTYALRETAFPRQSTGDQFFDHAQFDAYRALGHHIGAAGTPRPPAPS